MEPRLIHDVLKEYGIHSVRLGLPEYQAQSFECNAAQPSVEFAVF